ncbi:MAG: hypothetical protein KJ579_04310 [Verrucomicrobia bacterium]|nr:hypothetical protein [Verrucomicrobiota bacterium]
MTMRLPHASVNARLLALGMALFSASPQVHAAGKADGEWAAIEGCLEIIRQCQMNDGNIRVKGDGAAAWAVPYFGNLAAVALLAAHDSRRNSEDVARVGRWLTWYARHQEADGTIYDCEGTVSSCTSNGKRDSTDSYAATFLMAVGRYTQVLAKQPSAEILHAAAKALAAIEAVVQDDGLTIAKPDYAIKYLMNNVEVCQGLAEGARFFASVGMEKESRNAKAMAARMAGSMGKFWSERDASFAYALDMKDQGSGGLSEPYPHGLAQLFALAHMRPSRPGLWARVTRTFKPDDKGMPVERWLIAAKRNAGSKELDELRKATISAALRFSGKDVYVGRPAMTVIALLDGDARFADIPASGGKE